MEIAQTMTRRLKSGHVRARLKKRRRREKVFRLFGATSITLALVALAVLFISITSSGYSAFFQTHIRIDVFFDPVTIDPDNKRDPEILSSANYAGLVKKALRNAFPEVKGRSDKRKLYKLLSPGAAYFLREMTLNNPSIIGSTRAISLPADDDIDMFIKGYIKSDAKKRRVTDRQINWIRNLKERGAIEKRFNDAFFTQGDSREPELSGIRGALAGSILTMLITLALSFPIGVITAVYLEEFAPKNRLTDIIEVNINNLAAVPSIVFGLLGLAVFLNFFGLPRSTPLVGGLVLTLMTLPTIIIAARVSLQSVPPSIRQAALGVGASKMQSVLHHVTPLAMPGMMTGAIIGLARALGETAPLLMIGMVAFIVDIPRSFTDPATALPVQIYLWANSPERAFVERTSAAIMVLLFFLILMNGLAIWLRSRFETKW